MRVLLTGGGSGGHVSPALAVAKQLQVIVPDLVLLYVGGTLTMEGSSGESIESQLVTPSGIPFQAIHVGKLKRDKKLSWSTVTRLWGVVPGIWEAWRVVGQFRPDVVFSSGGYVSLPVVLAAWLHRVPIVIHEQTAAVGLANAWASRLATRVAITFPSSAAFFNPDKVVQTGNPLRTEIMHPEVDKLMGTQFGQWLTSQQLPVVYITGGGLGSHVINLAVEEELAELLTRVVIVHQAGSHAGFQDVARLSQLKSTLPLELQTRYWLAEHFSAMEVGLIYSRAGLVVARAGANTVLELAAWGLPAIFIPIPWVTHQEQDRNAQALVEAGTALILPEAKLSGATLRQAIEAVLDHRAEYLAHQDQAKDLVNPEATQKLAELVVELGR